MCIFGHSVLEFSLVCPTYNLLRFLHHTAYIRFQSLPSSSEPHFRRLCSTTSAITNFTELFPRSKREHRHKRRENTRWRREFKNPGPISHITRFFYKHCNIFAQAQIFLSKSQTFWKGTLPYLTKKFKMLLGISTIIFKWSHSLDLIIFRYSCFKIG